MPLFSASSKSSHEWQPLKQITLVPVDLLGNDSCTLSVFSMNRCLYLLTGGEQGSMAIAH